MAESDSIFVSKIGFMWNTCYLYGGKTIFHHYNNMSHINALRMDLNWMSDQHINQNQAACYEEQDE